MPDDEAERQVPQVVQAGGSLPTPDDEHLRQLASDVLANENKTVITFAKNLVTVCFSAIGVIVALQQYTSAHAAHRNIVVLGIAIALLLVASVVSSLAIQAVRLRVSENDYGMVSSELHRAAKYRYRLTWAALALIIVAVILATSVIL